LKKEAAEAVAAKDTIQFALTEKQARELSNRIEN
jgi:hypothetical protein